LEHPKHVSCPCKRRKGIDLCKPLIVWLWILFTCFQQNGTYKTLNYEFDKCIVIPLNANIEFGGITMHLLLVEQKWIFFEVARGIIFVIVGFRVRNWHIVKVGLLGVSTNSNHANLVTHALNVTLVLHLLQNNVLRGNKKWTQSYMHFLPKHQVI